MTVRGQFASPPIKGWIDVSPNPGYLGEEITIRFAIVSEKLYGKEAKTEIIIAPLPDIPIPPEEKVPVITQELEGNIPNASTYGFITDKILEEVTGGCSSEFIVQTWSDVEGYRDSKIGMEYFHVYNYSRPPENPYLALAKGIPSPHGSMAPTVRIVIINIASGSAKNVEIKDSLPSGFTLVSGSLTQKYDNIQPNESKIYDYTVIRPQKAGIFILDSATATYEDNKGKLYSSTSNPMQVSVVPPVTPTPAPPAPVVPSPTPSPKPTPSPSPTPIEKTPTPLPPPPPPDNGNDSWIFFLIAVVAGVVLLSIRPIMIAYYTRKMNKWERAGYDVSKLKEVLKR